MSLSFNRSQLQRVRRHSERADVSKSSAKYEVPRSAETGENQEEEEPPEGFAATEDGAGIGPMTGAYNRTEEEEKRRDISFNDLANISLIEGNVAQSPRERSVNTSSHYDLDFLVDNAFTPAPMATEEERQRMRKSKQLALNVEKSRSKAEEESRKEAGGEAR